jgi:hypothetical protein
MMWHVILCDGDISRLYILLGITRIGCKLLNVDKGFLGDLENRVVLAESS